MKPTLKLLVPVILSLVGCGSTSDRDFFELPPKTNLISTANKGRNNNADNLLPLNPVTPGNELLKEKDVTVNAPTTANGGSKGLAFNWLRITDSSDTGVLAVTNGTAKSICGAHIVYRRAVGDLAVSAVSGEHGFNTSYTATCLLPGQTGYVRMENLVNTYDTTTSVDLHSVIGISEEEYYDMGLGIKAISVRRINSNLVIKLRNQSARALYLCGSVAPTGNDDLTVFGFDGTGPDRRANFANFWNLASRDVALFAPNQEKEFTVSLPSIFPKSSITHMNVVTNYSVYPCITRKFDDDD